MVPKDKAKELVDKFELSFAGIISNNEDWETLAKECALIAVDEILDLNLGLSNCDENNWDIEKFYEEVKKEINKL